MFTFRKDVSENNFDPDLVKDDAGKIIRDNVWGVYKMIVKEEIFL